MNSKLIYVIPLLIASIAAPAQASTFDFDHQLTASDGAENDLFGGSVSLDNGFALIGALGDDDDGSSSGSAYLFDTDTGDFLQKLTAPDGAEDDLFGFSVSLDNGFALISAIGDDDNGSSSGSAYLFAHTSSEMTPEPVSILSVLGVVVAAAGRRRSR